ncbi:MAG: DUF695 domain-containing protein [Phycisphaerales bacterium]|jgi:hypothetical protein|nr:DUF695 domain-containing protein [Phycisphaeraceae bacterium]
MSESSNEKWIMFPGVEGDAHYFVRLDVAFGAERDPGATTHIRVRLSYDGTTARPNGLPTTEAFDRMVAVEEALVASASATAAVLVASRVGGHERDFHFYARDGRATAAEFRRVLDACPEWRPEVLIADDPGYTALTPLQPTLWQVQFAQNSSVVAALAESGNDATRPRPIDFCAFFRTESGRRSFAEVLVANGFEVDSEALASPARDDRDVPWELEFRRVCEIEIYNLTDITTYLEECASEHDGEFDGWETIIVPRE